MTEIIQVNQISKHYGGVNAVNKVTFKIKTNSITGLIGPNGAGKTTLFNLLSKFETPTSGSIVIEGINISELSAFELVEIGMCRTFQLTKVFPNLTVLENVMISKKTPNNFKTILKQIFHTDKNEVNRALEYLELAGLSEKKNELAKNLSYGQQKLLELARALATEPKILLLDEPLAGVNPVMIEEIKRKIKQINAQGTTILLIEHNLNAVMELCHEIIVMDHGELIAHASPEEVHKNPRVIEAYLGVKHE